MSRRSRGRRNVPERVFIPLSPLPPSSLSHLRVIHTYVGGTLTHGLFAIVCAHIAFFSSSLLLDNVHEAEARQTNRRSTCVLMNAVFDLGWDGGRLRGFRGFKTKRNMVEKLWGRRERRGFRV